MNTLWRIWVTLTLVYLLISGSHGGPGLAWTVGKVIGWGYAGARAISDWAAPAHATDIVITPCNRSGDCREER